MRVTQIGNDGVYVLQESNIHERENLGIIACGMRPGNIMRLKNARQIENFWILRFHGRVERLTVRGNTHQDNINVFLFREACRYGGGAITYLDHSHIDGRLSLAFATNGASAKKSRIA